MKLTDLIITASKLLDQFGDVEVIDNQGYQVRELVKRDATPEQLEF